MTLSHQKEHKSLLLTQREWEPGMCDPRRVVLVLPAINIFLALETLNLGFWQKVSFESLFLQFSPGQQTPHEDRGRTRPPPTPQASSPAPWASCWKWQDGSQSCSTEKVVKSIKMTFQVVASWPGNPQRTACPSILRQKDTLSCSWKKRSSFWDKFSLRSYNSNLNPSPIIASPWHQLT